MSLIRSATVADSEALFQIHLRAVALGGVDYYPDEILEAWHAGRSASGLAEVIASGGCFVLEEEGKTLGFVHVRDRELVGLFVAPEFQKRGCGSQLFQFAANQVNGRPMFLDSTLNAVSFYLKRGCVAGKIGCVRRNERDIYVHRMELR